MTTLVQGVKQKFQVQLAFPTRLTNYLSSSSQKKQLRSQQRHGTRFKVHLEYEN